MGSLATAGLGGLEGPRDGLAIPENVFALYQMVFAVITPALIVGAFPKRVRWLAAAGLCTRRPLGMGRRLDGAGRSPRLCGRIVVHTTAGIAALVLALMIGPRRGFPQSLIPPHSAAMTMIGARMLWVGWFGFNGGSALAAGSGARGALLATHLSACAGRWPAGLATVTPAAGFVSPTGGVPLGVAGALVCSQTPFSAA